MCCVRPEFRDRTAPGLHNQRAVRGDIARGSVLHGKNAQPKRMRANRGDLNLNLSFLRECRGGGRLAHKHGARGSNQALQHIPTIPTWPHHSYSRDSEGLPSPARLLGDCSGNHPNGVNVYHVGYNSHSSFCTNVRRDKEIQLQSRCRTCRFPPGDCRRPRGRGFFCRFQDGPKALESLGYDETRTETHELFSTFPPIFLRPNRVNCMFSANSRRTAT